MHIAYGTHTDARKSSVGSLSDTNLIVIQESKIPAENFQESKIPVENLIRDGPVSLDKIRVCQGYNVNGTAGSMFFVVSSSIIISNFGMAAPPRA